MRKFFLFASIVLLLNGCSILSELTAFTKCEFRFHSLQDPLLCGINVQNRTSFSDFNFIDGQMVVAQLLNGKLPFGITVNVEAQNPGTSTAAVNSIEWLAYIDDVEIARGVVQHRVEVAPNGGRSMIPIKIDADLFEYLEGDNPRAMLNFALNQVNAGDEPSRLSMKIKPSVLIGGQEFDYPGYFTITREFSGGN